MQIEKLFQVLVVGGALLSGMAVADAPVPAVGEEVQSAAPTTLAPIFCNQPEACEVGCDGKKKVKEGFECCWGTSCEQN